MVDCLAVTDSYYNRITVINERSKSNGQVTAASATSFYILKNFQEPTTYLEAIQGDLYRLWLLLAGAQQGPFRVSLITDIALRNIDHSRVAGETKVTKFTNKGCLHYVCHPGKDRA